MKRRAFLQSSWAATCLPFVASSRPAAAEEQGAKRQILVWTRYVIDNRQQRELVSNFLAEAALPALGRLGIKPVGVFTDLDPDQDLSVFVLTPFADWQQMATLTDRLAEDDEFVDAAEAYLRADPSQPAYQRIDNQLMRAFTGMPQVQIPRTGDRIFELRVYESHSEWKARLKVEMFNVAELEIFQKVGLDPVFFGETLVGSNLPNLTYMLGYQDMEEHDEAWKSFRAHPDWLALKDEERYRDTVSKIINRFLRPTSFSQI